MKITQKYFDHYLNKNYLFENQPRIIVAASGGPDSMCLVFLLKNWIEKHKGNLLVLIIDHKLRDESYKEAIEIRNYLFLNKIESKIIQINNNKIIKKNMNEARINRFQKLIKFCHRNNTFHLFLGHHYDDNLETYLLRKLAGSNFDGLRSIQNKSIYNNLQILRPLLNFKKEDILDFNRYNNIKFISDPSNFNLKYSRVVVRNFLLNNSVYKKKIEKDFTNIIKYYPWYKKMIFHKFNLLSVSLNKKKIRINAKIFFREDIEIQSKIIEIIHRYLKPKKKPIRYKKILLLIQLLIDKNNIKANFAGMSIEKDQFLINFC